MCDFGDRDVVDCDGCVGVDVGFFHGAHFVKCFESCVLSE